MNVPAGIDLPPDFLHGFRVKVRPVDDCLGFVNDHMRFLRAQGDVKPVGLVVSVDRMERGQGTKSALAEIGETYGLRTASIVTMEEVVECLWNREYKGRVVIDDGLKSSIDEYYRQYGAQ